MYLYVEKAWKLSGARAHHPYRTLFDDAGRTAILQTDQKSNPIAPGMTFPLHSKTALSNLIPSVYDDDIYMDKRRGVGMQHEISGMDCITLRRPFRLVELGWSRGGVT